MTKKHIADKPFEIYKRKIAKLRITSGRLIIVFDFDDFNPMEDVILEDVEIEIRGNATFIKGNRREFRGNWSLSYEEIKEASKIKEEFEDYELEEINYITSYWNWHYPFFHTQTEKIETLKHGWCTLKKRKPMCMIINNNVICVDGIDINLHKIK